MTRDIFISYSRRGLEAVKPIQAALEARCFNCAGRSLTASGAVLDKLRGY